MWVILYFFYLLRFNSVLNLLFHLYCYRSFTAVYNASTLVEKMSSIDLFFTFISFAFILRCLTIHSDESLSRLPFISFPFSYPALRFSFSLFSSICKRFIKRKIPKTIEEKLMLRGLYLERGLDGIFKGFY